MIVTKSASKSICLSELSAEFNIHLDFWCHYILNILQYRYSLYNIFHPVYIFYYHTEGNNNWRKRNKSLTQRGIPGNFTQDPLKKELGMFHVKTQ